MFEHIQIKRYIIVDFVVRSWDCYYRDKDPKLYIGHWTLAEDIGWFEDEKTAVRVLSLKSCVYVANW